MTVASAVRTETPDGSHRAEPGLLRLGDPAYPERLAEFDWAPSTLHIIGDSEALAPPAVAIVGTRSSTSYGERAAREIAGALARAGASIISGLARGIDAAAHRAALEAGGRTAAVLGAGIDVIYPVGHRELYATICARGAVISEFPPGTRPFSGCFPRRNRLIAAIADLTIVVEAGHKSGARITADYAMALGRDVAAVPGPIDSPQSAGTNRLLRDGAHFIASAADALTLAGLSPAAKQPLEMLGTPERAILTLLTAGALNLEAITNCTGLPARECLAAITALELAGAIECEMTGEIRRR